MGLLVALAVLSTPALLFAHARLVRSDPPAKALLPRAPTKLSLWFSERPEPRFTSIQLTDATGATISLGPVAPIDSMGVSVAIAGAMNAGGAYTVTWKTAASDGHATSGTYTFSTSAPATAAQAPAGAPVISVDTGRHTKPAANALLAPDTPTPFSSGMRWVELVALLSTIGLIIFRLAVLPPSKWPNELVVDSIDRAVRLARAVVLLFAIATLTRAFAQADLIPNAGNGRFGALMTLVQHTRWGFGWAIGAVGTVIALVGLLAAGKRLGGWITAAIGVVAICTSEALTGHAGASRHYAAAIAVDVAHVLGAGGWLGGLTAILLCGLPALKRLSGVAKIDAGRRLLQTYHGTATECVTIVVATGVAAAWLRLPAFNALWTTPYGSMLFRKTVFVFIVLLFGLYHWRRIIVPAWTDDTLFRFRRSALGELVFGAIVVGITALLVTLPLP